MLNSKPVGCRRSSVPMKSAATAVVRFRMPGGVTGRVREDPSYVGWLHLTEKPVEGQTHVARLSG